MKDTILIVDDRPNMIGLVKKVLQGEGRLVTAPSGRAAIRSARGSVPSPGYIRLVRPSVLTPSPVGAPRGPSQIWM